MTTNAVLLKVLLIEDNPDDALVMKDALARTKRAVFEVEIVERLAHGLERLGRGGIDVVVLDLSLPDSSGAETLRRVRAQESSVPVVVLTGVDRETLGFELLKEGAQDYVLKGQVDGDLMARSMLYAIERQRLLTESQAARESAEARLQVVVENTPVIMFALDQIGVFTLSEGRSLEALGREPREMVGKSIFDVYHDEPDILAGVLAALAGQPRSLIVEHAGVTFEARHEPLRDQAGEIVGVVGVSHDITERTRLEKQFLQAQKMEVVGQLAGGVAHDFNNLLTAVLGYAQLGIGELAPENPVTGYLREIKKASERGSQLASQLLAFSRQQPVELNVIDLNGLVLEMDQMLRRLIGEDVELAILPDRDIASVKVDPGHMQQVLMNLAVNARDAMPDGGILIIETGETALDDDDVATRHPEMAPGHYVVFTVSDTGTGMTEEVRARAFEPFFTTKGPGAGTGLGMSTCYGLVRQSGGDIELESEPGRGTTCRVFLPAVKEVVSSLPHSDDPSLWPVGHETVLIAEDEPSVRGVTSNVLRQQGYDVLEASDGYEALRLAQDRTGEEIDLLLTDIVMPVMGGRELAEQLTALYPNTRVLMTSGYAADSSEHPDSLNRGDAFMQKPFTPATLAQKVREVLDRGLGARG